MYIYTIESNKLKNEVMENTRIYTNGKSLFTLENFGKTAGVCETNGINLHSTVSQEKAQAMHQRGQLHYVFGTGDRIELNGIKLSRRTKLDNFNIH